MASVATCGALQSRISWPTPGRGAIAKASLNVNTEARRYSSNAIVNVPHEQERLRNSVVVKGDREKAVSELAEGRRTIVRDVDDPAMEANILDSLMVSRAEEFAADLQEVYMPVSVRGVSPSNERYTFVLAIVVLWCRSPVFTL